MTTIADLPSAPLPTDSTSNFNNKAFAFVAALNNFIDETNTVAGEVVSNRDASDSSRSIAVASATSASTSADTALFHASAAAANTNAPKWVSGTTYTVGSLVYSPVTGRSYRRSVAGAGTTDPSSDSSNWTALMLEVSTGRPSIRPSLLLDFANTKQLDPRITFTRASTASFYDGKTTAKAEENLLTYSQDFTNAIWVKTTTTVTGNSFAAPDTTTTAGTLTATGANSTTLQTFTATAVPYTYSVYLYRKTGTGNVDITVDGTTWVTQSITAGWTRFSTTLTPSAGSKTAGVRLVTSGDEVYVWGEQLEQRSTVTAYTPTTTAPITNYIPVLLTAASGVPRFDHNPTTGESLGFLVEEQRTNLLTYSEQFDNAAWTELASTVSADQLIAPNGTLAAEKLSEDTSTATHSVYQSPTLTDNTVYTNSIYAKKGSKSIFVLGIVTKAGGQRGRLFDLSNGTSSAITLSGWTTAPTGFGIQDVGNGWYRCWVSNDVATGAFTANYGVFLAQDAATLSYTGDVNNNIYVWGAQLEAGAFPTSYIPTVASQVTRSADSASMTGTNFSSWYRADEGTLYAEWNSPSIEISTRIAFSISDGTMSNFIVLSKAVSLRTSSELYVGGVKQVGLSSAVSNFPGKASLTYAANNVAASTNGLLDGTDTVCVIPVVSQAHIGDRPNLGRQLNGTIKRIAYYPKRLSNTELQGLTA